MRNVLGPVGHDMHRVKLRKPEPQAALHVHHAHGGLAEYRHDVLRNP